MEGEHRIKQLVHDGILEDSDEQFLELTDEYHDWVEQQLEDLEQKDDILNEITGTLANERAESLLLNSYDDERELAAEYRVLAEKTDGLSSEELLEVLLAFKQIQYRSDHTEGVPEPFLPVDGAHLDTFIRLHHRAIVYIWRDDCDPCEVMREEFDEMFDQPPTNIALLAVFGPEIPENILETYDIAGAPTTLFVLNGEIDARLIGPHYGEVIENEVEILREAN